MSYDKEFWNSIDELVKASKVIIDRKRGSCHPRYPDFIYPVNYGYLEDTKSMDGNGIDVWLGSLNNSSVQAIICTVDLTKRDSEIKILLGCTEEETSLIYQTHNSSSSMKGILIRR